MPLIYLDNSATTRPFDRVTQAMRQGMEECWFNPSALYGPAVDAYRALKQARQQVAALAGAQADALVFTSGGTESNNLAILGGRSAREQRIILCGPGEHPSVREPAEYLARNGYIIRTIPSDQTGAVASETVLSMMDPEVALVCLMHVQNEVGAVNDVTGIARTVKEKYPGVRFHVDGVQAYGRIPLHLTSSLIDTYAFSAHKLHGPKGVGGLFVRNIRIQGYQLGGGQEDRRRSGTENLPGILGFAQAAELFAQQGDIWIPGLMEMKLKLARALLDIPGTTVNGPPPDCGAPHILNVSFDGVEGETLVHAMEARDVLVGTGAACSSKKSRESSALSALGLSRQRINSAVRFSLSVFNTHDEMERTAQIAWECVKELRRFKRR